MWRNSNVPKKHTQNLLRKCFVGDFNRKVADYHHGTLPGLLGGAHLPFPIHLTHVGMKIALPTTDDSINLQWLNTPFPKEAERLIQTGLRQRLFDTLKDHKTRRPFETLNQVI
ncbi:hypothetical protein WDW37_04635 [Bdellovibrionota bacterium FG-1]